MSHIPPLVCDTPPPIDFGDSNEDDFGDGMFSNYDGSSLPTTPKQMSTVNNQHDLPVDVPELPDVPDLPSVHDIPLTELTDDFEDLNGPLQLEDLPLPNVLDLPSDYGFYAETNTKIIEQTDNSKIEKVHSITEETALERHIPAEDDTSDSPTKQFNKSIEPQSSDNSTSSHSIDNVNRSESPPSLVFSTGSLNCDDNNFEDFDEFPANNDDVENLPSLKLDSISDSKSQSSDLEEANQSTVSEIVNETTSDEKDIRPELNNAEVFNSNYDVNVDNEVLSQSNCIEYKTDCDDSFDDFVEYEAVIIEERDKDSQQQNEEFKLCDENNFTADFSQFDAFSEQKIDETLKGDIKDDRTNIVDAAVSESHLDHRSEHTCTKSKSESTLSIENFEDFNNVDDDEFGEFNDFSNFTQPQTCISSITTDISELAAKVKPLLDLLFPIGADADDGSFDRDPFDLTNDTTKILQDFENSKALDHQWLSSVGKNSLVTALGIDSRNILYGGKWNNSMPRFAANLGFSPLEPMKPTTISATTPNTTSSVSSNEIPAAQFDWNSSGLVNPLDGVQEILHKANSAENQSSRSELDWHSTKAEPTIIAATPPLSSISSTLNIKSNNLIVDEEQLQTSSSYVVPGSSGTLKETHIFTPSKSSYSIPQSRDISNDKHEPKFVDFDYEKAAVGIIIDENVVKKEYRDVEYNPDKPITSPTSPLSSDEFSDFQSVPIPITTQIPHKLHQNIVSTDFGILQPTKPSDVITINWPEPGKVIDATDLESFDDYKSVERVNVNDVKRSSIDFTSISKCSSSPFGEFSKPVIGVSPSDIMFQTNSNSVEEEFSDFQSVEPMPSQTHQVNADALSNSQPKPLQGVMPSNLTELPKFDDSVKTDPSTELSSWINGQSPRESVLPITNVPSANILQPAPLQPLRILTPQTINPQPILSTNTIWPESEIDPEEIARLEAIFPQMQKQSQTQFSSSNSFQTTTLNNAKSTEGRTQPSSTTQEDDEWSDFVSVPTPAPQPLPITNIISANIAKHQQDDDEWSDFVSSTSQSSVQPWSISSGPSFTSWNAPSQFDSWQNSTFYQSPQQFAPTLPTMTNNNNVTTLTPNQSTLMNTKSSQNSFFTQKAPSISLIPDLGFVAPKTLVNRSRTNFQNK